MYSLNIEIRRVGFHETPILNKNRISILCLDENLDKGNPLVYVDFWFVFLVLVKPVLIAMECQESLFGRNMEVLK